MSKLDLLKHTSEITRIDCSTCNRAETVQDPAEEAIDELHQRGWRVKGKKCLCPKCSGNNWGDGFSEDIVVNSKEKFAGC